SLLFVFCVFFFLRGGCAVGFFFFFQAEDGIRDTSVTGVQTCALPISPARSWEIRRGSRPAWKITAIARRFRRPSRGGWASPQDTVPPWDTSACTWPCPCRSRTGSLGWCALPCP